jgi:hypothetical protein
LKLTEFLMWSTWAPLFSILDPPLNYAINNIQHIKIPGEKQMQQWFCIKHFSVSLVQFLTIPLKYGLYNTHTLSHHMLKVIKECGRGSVKPLIRPTALNSGWNTSKCDYIWFLWKGYTGTHFVHNIYRPSNCHALSAYVVLRPQQIKI